MQTTYPPLVQFDTRTFDAEARSQLEWERRAARNEASRSKLRSLRLSFLRARDGQVESGASC